MVFIFKPCIIIYKCNSLIPSFSIANGEVPSIDGLETKQNKIKLMSDSVPHRAQCVVKRDIKQINKHVIKN